MNARALLAASVALVGLAVSPRSALAQDDAPETGAEPELHEEPCHLARFAGKLVTAEFPPVCGRICSHARLLRLEDAVGNVLFGVDATSVDDEPDPPTLACSDGALVLAQEGQALHFEWHGGALRLAPADRRRALLIWQRPELRAEAIEAREWFGTLLRVAYAGLGSDAPTPQGLGRDVPELVELAVIRDHLRAGEFQVAEERIAWFEGHQRDKDPELAPELAPHVVELQHELDAARRRSMPFSLGPRRFVGGAQRPLRTPFDLEAPPELFFRGSELCVVDVAPPGKPQATPGKPDVTLWPEDRMRCFAPSAKSARPSEPFVAPASSAVNLGHRQLELAYNRCKSDVLLTQAPFPGDTSCVGGTVVGLNDLLAVVDRDAMVAVDEDAGELVLVRSHTDLEKISPAAARQLVAASAGTRLFTATASYFSDTRRVVQVAGGESKTWDMLGAPPEHTSWFGWPLVSPDQRWVVTQSAGAGQGVSLWVFPIVR